MRWSWTMSLCPLGKLPSTWNVHPPEQKTFFPDMAQRNLHVVSPTDVLGTPKAKVVKQVDCFSNFDKGYTFLLPPPDQHPYPATRYMLERDSSISKHRGVPRETDPWLADGLRVVSRLGYPKGDNHRALRTRCIAVGMASCLGRTVPVWPSM